MIALTLEELMKQFHLPVLVLRLTHLTDAAALLATIGDVPFKDIDEETRTDLVDLVQKTQALCESIRFDHARQKAYTLLVRIEKLGFTLKARDLGVSLEDLKSDIEICMFSHNFVQVEEAVRKYLKPLPMFGEATLKAFPNCINDVKDAGECIAVDLNTAAVFHLMHVVEWGLRALCLNLKVTKIKKGPIAFATWDDILKKLPDAVNAKVNAMGRGHKKQKVQEFYHPALKEIGGFKDAWRNHIMHTRASYTREDAIAVFTHVQRFMQGLAEYGIKEV